MRLKFYKQSAFSVAFTAKDEVSLMLHSFSDGAQKNLLVELILVPLVVTYDLKVQPPSGGDIHLVIKTIHQTCPVSKSNQIISDKPFSTQHLFPITVNVFS